MMNYNEIFHIYVRAHFDAIIVAIAKIPSGRMALYDPIGWLFDNRFARVAHIHVRQAHARVEFIGRFKHSMHTEILLLKRRCDIDQSDICEWSRVVVQMMPCLSPQIAQQMSRYR